MKEIVRKYIDDKCSRCDNKNAKIEEDKCDVRTYQYENYSYCKCCNMSEDNKELKQKII